MKVLPEKVRELAGELAGTECRCGYKKKPRQTFCTRCYFRLTPELRRDLYRRFGDGYEEAYEAAVAVLDQPQT
jgi:hypothetical protein